MKFVYILQSLAGEHFYTGITDDLDARLKKQFRGGNTHVEVPVVAHQELRHLCGRGAGNRIRRVFEIRIGTCLRQSKAVGRSASPNP